MTKRLSEEEKNLGKLRRRVLAYEKRRNIHYATLKHPFGKTCEEIATYYRQSEYADLDYSHCKNLFLVGKPKIGPKKLYLLITDINTNVDSDNLKDSLYLESLSFASEEEIREVLGGQPGAISLLNLVLIKKGIIQLLVDKNIMHSEFLVFHPIDGRESQFMPTEDAMKIIEDVAPQCWEPDAGHRTFIDIVEKKNSSEISIADREKEIEALLESQDIKTYSWVFENQDAVHKTIQITFRHMMLEDDNNNIYMLVLPNNKSVKFNDLIEMLGSNSLKKMSSDEIIELLGISQKNMSLLSIRNNKGIKLIVDSSLELKYEYLDLYADTNELVCSIPTEFLDNIFSALGENRCSTMAIPGDVIRVEDRAAINAAAAKKKKK